MSLRSSSLSCIFYDIHEEDCLHCDPNSTLKNYCKHDKEDDTMSSADILLHKKIEVEDAISQLALAKSLEIEANSLKARAATVLVPYMALEGLKSFNSSKSPGSVQYIPPGVSKEFNKEKAAQEFLTRGVSADVIQSVYDHATEQNPRAEYVKFIPTK